VPDWRRAAFESRRGFVVMAGRLIGFYGHGRRWAPCSARGRVGRRLLEFADDLATGSELAARR